MAGKIKSICKWKKDNLKDNLDELKKVVKNPRFICKKCGRAVSDDNYICKPEKI